MDYGPYYLLIATQRVREQSRTARPDAPVIPDRPNWQHSNRVRTRIREATMRYLLLIRPLWQ